MKNHDKKQQAVVITDCFGPAWYYLPILERMQIVVINVVSTPEIADMFPSTAPYAGIVKVLDGSQDSKIVLDALAEFNITAVMAGFESGVPLADRLAKALQLPGNDDTYSQARRNKLLMQRRLEEAGVPSTETALCRNLNELNTFLASPNQFPIVVKPLDSAGTDGVVICATNEEAISAASNILSKKNIFGVQNDAVLVQEYLDGDEYMINTISANGRHYLSEIWLGTKLISPLGHCVYDNEVLLCSSDEKVCEIVQYVYKVLDALGIVVGPAHTELKLTKRGPILLETGARLSGGVHPNALIECLGYNTAALAIDSYIKPERVTETLGKPYTRRKYYISHLCALNKSGRVIDAPILDLLQTLPSYFDHRLKIKLNHFAPKTIDLNTVPLIVELINEDRAQLEHDHIALRNMEQSGFVFE